MAGTMILNCHDLCFFYKFSVGTTFKKRNWKGTLSKHDTTVQRPLFSPSDAYEVV
jgi:hypothetical protein